MTEHFLMIDLCNKKKSCIRHSWEEIKEPGWRLSKFHDLCCKKLREVSSGTHESCVKPHMLQNRMGFFHWIFSSMGKEPFPFYRSLHLWLSLPAQALLIFLHPWLLCLLPFLYLTLQYIRSMVAIIRLCLLNMTGPPSWSRDCLDAVARTTGWVEQGVRFMVIETELLTIPRIASLGIAATTLSCLSPPPPNGKWQ